jgi:hypothetical protein
VFTVHVRFRVDVRGRAGSANLERRTRNSNPDLEPNVNTDPEPGTCNDEYR